MVRLLLEIKDFSKHVGVGKGNSENSLEEPHGTSSVTS